MNGTSYRNRIDGHCQPNQCQKKKQLQQRRQRDESISFRRDLIPGPIERVASRREYSRLLQPQSSLYRSKSLKRTTTNPNLQGQTGANPGREGPLRTEIIARVSPLPGFLSTHRFNDPAVPALANYKGRSSALVLLDTPSRCSNHGPFEEPACRSTTFEESFSSVTIRNLREAAPPAPGPFAARVFSGPIV